MSQLVRASFALESEGDKIHILPAGPVVVAKDQRIFQITDAAKAIAASSTPMLVDWEHASEMWGGSTRSAGWISSLELRANGIWGTVQWTAEGQRDVSSQAYKFLSPVIELDPETRDVTQIISVALTNKPALTLSAVGDVAAYRERVRIACSLRETADLSSLSNEVIERLRQNGRKDAEIKGALAFEAQQRAEAVKRAAAPRESEVRAHCMSRGMSAAEYEAASRFSAERHAAMRGERA